MKTQILTIFLLAIIVSIPTVAQTSPPFDIKNTLFSSCHNCFDDLDSLIQVYGEENVLNELIQIPFNQNDSLVLPMKNSSNNTLKGIWYLLNDTYVNRIPAMVKVPDSNNNTVVNRYIGTQPFYISNRIKLIYWAWLIYSDSVGIAKLLRNNSEMHILIDSIKRTNGKSGYLFDYVNTYTHYDWTLSIFRRDTTSWVKEIDSTFENWKTMLKEKGLPYLRKNKISPISSPYKFITVEAVDQTSSWEPRKSGKTQHPISK